LTQKSLIDVPEFNCFVRQFFFHSKTNFLSLLSFLCSREWNNESSQRAEAIIFLFSPPSSEDDRNLNILVKGGNSLQESGKATQQY
jgi:hypothetical protein